MKKQKRYIKFRVFCGILFVIYILLLIYLVFFVGGRTELAHSGGYAYNLVPFKEIERFYNYRPGGDLAILSLINLGGNIVLFIPFGFLLPVIVRPFRNFFVMFGLSFLAAAAIEITQLLTHRGVCDIDDIILNTIGGTIGAIIILILLGIIHLRNRRKRNR